MTEYFALAIAVSFPLYVYGLHGILLMFLAGLICVGFACGDEFHQSFIAGRSPSARDVCIDSVGVFFGIIVVRIIGWTGRKTVFKEKVKVKQKKPKKKLKPMLKRRLRQKRKPMLKQKRRPRQKQMLKRKLRRMLRLRQKLKPMLKQKQMQRRKRRQKQKLKRMQKQKRRLMRRQKLTQQNVKQIKRL